MKPFITVLALALMFGGCASTDEGTPPPTAQELEAQKAAEELKAMEQRSSSAADLAQAQQAQRDKAAAEALEMEKAADEKAAAEAAAIEKANAQAAADKAAAEKAAVDKAAREKAAADKAAAEKAAADKNAADAAAAEKTAKAAVAASGAAAAATSTNKENPVATPSDLNVVAEVETTAGKMVIGFLPDVAPGHVKNFVELSKKGFYDGTRFHRTIPGFMIQGGDPNSKDLAKQGSWGIGDPGYKIKAEFNKTQHVRGILSMARSQNPDSAGSQFFICHGRAESLDNHYTAFGELLSGYDVLDKIATAPATMSANGEKSKPVNPVQITKVTIRPRTPADVKQGG